MVEKRAVLMVLLGVFVFGYVMLAGSLVLRGGRTLRSFCTQGINSFLIHWAAKRFSVLSSSVQLHVFTDACVTGTVSSSPMDVLELFC